MSWARDSTSGVLTHSGTTRDYWEAKDSSGTPIALPATAEVSFQVNLASKNIKFWIGSGDGRSGHEVGIEGTDVVIRKVDFNDEGSALDSAAHGIGSTEPFTLTVRLLGDKIRCTVLRTSGAAVSIETAITAYENYKSWGFICHEDGGTVSFATYTELTPRQGSVSEIPWAVGGGELHASYNGTTLELVASRLFGISDQVSGAVLNGWLYLVGGGRGWIWKPVERVVIPFVPTAGSLPGQGNDGTTDAKIACVYRAGLCLSGVNSTANAVYRSAIGEGLNFNTGELTPGHAIVFGTGAERSTLHIADSIIALSVLNDNVLFIGCQNSAYTLVGDPAEGAAQLMPMSLFSGVSGPKAIATAEEGVNVVHCPEGLYAVQLGRSPVPISQGVLRSGITFPRARRDSYRVSIVRDASRSGMHIWISGSDSRHFWFDERLGYAGSAGGFFPESYHASVGNPTVGWIWKGQVIFGTTTGKICRFNGTTDLGYAIASKATLGVLGEGDDEAFEPDNDTVLTGLCVTLGADSEDATVKVFGGRTAEDAYSLTSRYELLGGQVAEPGAPTMLEFKVRAPFLTIELSSSSATPLVLEAVHCESYSDERTDLALVAEAEAPPAPCSPESGSGGGGDGDTAPPGPGPGTHPTGLGSAPGGSNQEGSVVER